MSLATDLVYLKTYLTGNRDIPLDDEVAYVLGRNFAALGFSSRAALLDLARDWDEHVGGLMTWQCELLRA